MMLRVCAAAIAPDLRFGVARALADSAPLVLAGGVGIRAEGCLLTLPTVPVYLRYADRDAVIVADGVESLSELEPCLGEQIGVVAESGGLDAIGEAVIALDAVDRCFRESGLWPGNIYLAGIGALTVVMDLVRVAEHACREPEVVLRELAALELAYLFPIAGKFRSGVYDGQVQYRLNGWGRALAERLTASHFGAPRAAVYRQAVSRRLADHCDRYVSFLAGLDVARQHCGGDQLEAALALPIPVLA
jgi:hypothetical protein